MSMDQENGCVVHPRARRRARVVHLQAGEGARGSPSGREGTCVVHLKAGESARGSPVTGRSQHCRQCALSAVALFRSECRFPFGRARLPWSLGDRIVAVKCFAGFSSLNFRDLDGSRASPPPAVPGWPGRSPGSPVASLGCTQPQAEAMGVHRGVPHSALRRLAQEPTVLLGLVPEPPPGHVVGSRAGRTCRLDPP